MSGQMLSAATIRLGVAIGERIRVQALMQYENTPGGNSKITYAA